MTDDNTDKELEALIARSLVDRGELIPTSVEEVLDTRGTDDVELPASLQNRYQPRTIARIRPVRVLSYVGAFAAAAAAVWALLVFTKKTEPISSDATVTPSAAPAASASTKLLEKPTNVSLPACGEECCAGSACSAAKGDLETCPTERTCIPCSGTGDPETFFRVRVGDFLPSNPKAERVYLDLCIKVGDPRGEWSCEPAQMPPSMRPRGRFLKTASRGSDLARGVAMELRANGKEVYGTWWSIIEADPRTLCRGTKVNFENDQKEAIGTLSMFLERTYYVELASLRSRRALDDVARAFSFDGLTPQFITAGSRHILALGPFDRPDAERILEQLKSEGARIDHGDDYGAW